MLKSQLIIKLFLAIILIPIGFLTKVYSGFGSEFATNYLGGVFYVIFLIILSSLVFPKTSPLKISLIVFAFTFFIELTQIIQNDILNSLRSHFLIKTLIGSTFNIYDMVYYTVGAFVGYGILVALKKRQIV
jgi:hypothetical protein